jgi:hypothetical protein
MAAMIDLGRLPDRLFAVLGLGRSGLAAATSLLAGGKQVWAWDDDAAARDAAAARVHPVVDLAACDLSGVGTLVLSPGIPHTHPEPHPVVARLRAPGLRDHRRCRASAAKSARGHGCRRHRHQRQVDHHGADRPHSQRGRLRRRNRRQHRRAGA